MELAPTGATSLSVELACHFTMSNAKRLSKPDALAFTTDYLNKNLSRSRIRAKRKALPRLARDEDDNGDDIDEQEQEELQDPPTVTFRNGTQGHEDEGVGLELNQGGQIKMSTENDCEPAMVLATRAYEFIRPEVNDGDEEAEWTMLDADNVDDASSTSGEVLKPSEFKMDPVEDEWLLADPTDPELGADPIRESSPAVTAANVAVRDFKAALLLKSNTEAKDDNSEKGMELAKPDLMESPAKRTAAVMEDENDGFYEAVVDGNKSAGAQSARRGKKKGRKSKR